MKLEWSNYVMQLGSIDQSGLVSAKRNYLFHIFHERLVFQITEFSRFFLKLREFPVISAKNGIIP